MHRNYFVYGGQKYYYGTQIVVLKQDHITGRMVEADAKFMYYDTAKEQYAFKIKNCVVVQDKKYFDKIFVGIGDSVIDEAKFKELLSKADLSQFDQKKFVDELKIDGLCLALVWYIFIMIISSLFEARLGLWALSTIVFLIYRHTKI